MAPSFRPNIAELDALTNIHRIALALKADIGHDMPLPTTSPSKHGVPEFVLSLPEDLLAPISEIDIPENTRQLILQRIHDRIAELKENYATGYKRAYSISVLESGFKIDPTSVYRAYHSLAQRNCIPLIKSWVSLVEVEAAKYKQAQAASFEIKKPFNNDFIPALETYFTYNGYPSVHHRSILAQRSGMTPRQIEVWFQNHRKRSKQDGKVVQRLDSDIPLKRALSVSPKNSQPYQLRLLTPSDDGMSGDNMIHKIDIQRLKPASCLEETPETHEDDLFRPPHSFPETRGSQHNDPFPNDNGVFRFPPPIWRRKPATTPIIPTEVDMDDFARTFHMKLNFVNGPWKRESTPSKSDLPSFTPWFAPSRTIPSRAPHPALVRTHVSSLVETSFMSPLTTDPYTFDFRQNSNEPGISCVVRLPYGPALSDSSIIERLEYLDETPRRQVAPLPRRAPSSPTPSAPFPAPSSPTPSASLLAPPGEVLRRKVSPLPRRAPSKTQSFGSRTSSFSSESSSSSDDTISSPSTPPSLSNQTLVSVEADDPTYNFDNYNFDFSSLTSNPSPRTFDFSEEKSPYDEQSSTLFQDFTPLVTC